MSGRSTKRTQQRGKTTKTLEDLEKEAKDFTKKSSSTSKTTKEEPLTSRQHLAGLVLAGLLARSQGLVSMADLRKEAYQWADYLLEE